MRTLLATLGGAEAGFGAGWVLSRRTRPGLTRAQAASVTRQIFVVTLWAGIAWISTSYLMAVYAMAVLGQVYTLTELSRPALEALVITMGSKVISNIFEHNNNKFFGTSVRGDAERTEGQDETEI